MEGACCNSAQQCIAWLGLAVRDAHVLALLAPLTLPGNHPWRLWKEACPAKSMFELSWQGCRHACVCLCQHVGCRCCRRYIGVTEADYEWLTDQIVQVANR